MIHLYTLWYKGELVRMNMTMNEIMLYTAENWMHKDDCDIEEQNDRIEEEGDDDALRNRTL